MGRPGWAAGQGAAVTSVAAITDMVVEDFADQVTRRDTGTNDFSGNSGEINKDGANYIQCGLTPLGLGHYAKRCAWDFNVGIDPEAYTGLFFCIFGLCDVKATFTGDPLESNAEQVFFREHSLDLDRIDGILDEPGGPRAATGLGITLSYAGAAPLALRLELRDADGGTRYKRFTVAGSDDPQSLPWEFRQGPIGDTFDLHRAKTLNLVIERNHEGDDVHNPSVGQFDLHRIWLVPSRAETRPGSDGEFLDLAERRAFQYFIDWSSRKQALENHPGRSSFGIPQDRSSFGDLLTVGGIGFGLPPGRRLRGTGDPRAGPIDLRRRRLAFHAGTRHPAVLSRLEAPGKQGGRPVRHPRRRR